MTTHDACLPRLPNLPPGARLLHIMGKVTVPQQATSAYMDGAAPYGGAGFLLRRKAVDPNVNPRVRIVGAGMSIAGIVSMAASADVAAMTTVTVMNMFGVAAPFHAERLWYVGAGPDLTIENGGAKPIAYASNYQSTYGTDLGPLYVTAGLVIKNNHAVTVQYASVIAGLSLASRVGEVSVRLVRRRCDSDGTVLAGHEEWPEGASLPIYPEPRPNGGAPTIHPVGGECADLDLPIDGAYGIEVDHVASGLSAGCVVMAHLLVASWK